MKVVPPAEYLKVVAVGYESLGDLINLLWFLRLAPPLAEDHIALYVESGFSIYIPLHSNKASLLSMLKVVTVTLGDLAVDGLFDPGDLIDEFVAVFLHHLQCKAVLRIDHPNEQEPISLDLVERDVQDVLVVQGVVGDGNTSGRVG